jgi:hypothetical protein
MDDELQCKCVLPDKCYIYGYFATWLCKVCGGYGLDVEPIEGEEDE